MTSKQRAFLKSLAMDMNAIVQIGKDGMTPEITKALDEALAARELVKVNVQKNYFGDLNELGEDLASRTNSDKIQTIGRKIVFYRPGKGSKKKIELPR